MKRGFSAPICPAGIIQKVCVLLALPGSKLLQASA